MASRNYKERPCAGECGTVQAMPEGWMCDDCRKALLIGRKLMAIEPEDKQPFSVDSPHIRVVRYDKKSTVSLHSVEFHSYRYNWTTHGDVADIIEETLASLREQATMRYGRVERDRAHYAATPGPAVLRPPEYRGFTPIFNPELRIDYIAPVVELSPRTVELLRILHRSMQDSLQMCYDDGYRDGSNLLRSMAEGRLTMAEMNRYGMGVEAGGERP